MLPDGFEWRSWDACGTPVATTSDESYGVLQDHAMVKFRSFVGGIDAEIFPSLGTYEGCHRLMTVIAGRVDFLPRGTWLIVSTASEQFGPIAVGTIQVCQPTQGQAAIQNIGIVPEFQGLGLGQALLAKSLHALRQDGLKRATLEVTARNESAVRFYERFGFRRARSSYRRVMLPRQSALAAAK